MVEIEKFFNQYKSAVYEKEIDLFVSLYAADVHVFDLWGQWSIEGADDWKSMVSDWFGSLGDERIIVEFSDKNSMLADNLSFATAFVTYKAFSVDGKELRSLQNRLTWVLKQQEDGWKIIHEHTSAPLNPETGKAIFKR